MSWKELKNKLNGNTPLNYYRIASDAVDQVWEEAEPILQKAMIDPDFMNTAYVYDNLMEFEKQLWIGDDKDSRIRVVAVTEILVDPYSDTTKMVINYCACDDEYEGHVDTWAKSLDECLNAFAKHQQCKTSEIWGRPGWLKKLEGYKAKMIVMQKEL